MADTEQPKELTEEEKAELERQHIEKSLSGPRLDMVINPVRTITEIEPDKTYVVQLDPRLINQDAYVSTIQTTLTTNFPTSKFVFLMNLAYLQRPSALGVYR